MDDLVVKREFKGIWIPKEIWLNNTLTIQEKIVLAEIDSFESEKGCFASNKYLGKIVQLSPSRVSNIISQLIEKKYLKAKIVYKPKSQAIQLRILHVNKGRVFGKENS